MPRRPSATSMLTSVPFLLSRNARLTRKPRGGTVTPYYRRAMVPRWPAETAVPAWALEGGETYTHVAAGKRHMVLLRSDGAVVACGGSACRIYLAHLPLICIAMIACQGGRIWVVRPALFTISYRVVAFFFLTIMALLGMVWRRSETYKR